MEKRMIFEGIATALITPMRDGKIDYGALSDIIDAQIECGIGALVVAGTTGEASTLTAEERIALFKFSYKHVNGRTKLIFGTGSNDTELTVLYSKWAKECGADAALIVTPYYNKGTEEGVYRHYERVTESTDIPVILYNVPSRTGVNLPIKTIKRLMANERIAGIKEASDSVERQMELYALGDTLPIYAGNDSQIYLNSALGGAGTISVLSNLFPEAALGIYRAFKAGECSLALRRQRELLPFIKLLFSDTSPAPIKYAMSQKFLCEEEMRLPLSVIGKELGQKIYREYKRLCRLGYA